MLFPHHNSVRQLSKNNHAISQFPPPILPAPISLVINRLFHSCLARPAPSCGDSESWWEFRGTELQHPTPGVVPLTCCCQTSTCLSSSTDETERKENRLSCGCGCKKGGCPGEWRVSGYLPLSAARGQDWPGWHVTYVHVWRDLPTSCRTESAQWHRRSHSRCLLFF